MWGDREGEYLTAKLPSLRAASLITNMCMYSPQCVWMRKKVCVLISVCVCVWHMCLEALTNELTL